MELVIGVDDPRAEDVRALLAAHLAFCRDVTPAEYTFALDVDQLVEPGVTFFSARRAMVPAGVAALKRLDGSHAELKSMHTRAPERGRGVGMAMVKHLLAFAEREGYRRVSLETGATDEFVPARALYAKAGFRPCGPFGDYRSGPYNTFMTIDLGHLDQAAGVPDPGVPDPGAENQRAPALTTRPSTGPGAGRAGPRVTLLSG